MVQNELGTLQNPFKSKINLKTHEIVWNLD